MSTKFGIIAEGLIDEILLAPLVERIARERAYFTWPTLPEHLGSIIPLRKRGAGGVLDALRRLLSYLEQNAPTDHAFFVILLDRRTARVHDRIRRLIRGKPLFLLGTAIEEIEAWWLADRRNTLAWAGIEEEPEDTLAYWQTQYRPERDPQPKRTLDEVTAIAPNLDERYGHGNAELAREFADGYWRERAELDAIERHCPRGFGRFCKAARQTLIHEKRRQGRLL